MAEIISVSQLLSLQLEIPDYQRPYKWTIQNVVDLLNDISNAIIDAERYRQAFKYRIGTIILHRNEDGVYEVVDGQQRVITLTLLKLFLQPDFHCTILEKDFVSRVTQGNIHANYLFIREWFSLKSQDTRDAFCRAMDDILETVVICVDRVSEAFQLFDSQNARGKPLDPHDLLKAYHLRAMKDDRYEMEHAVTKWEAQSTDEIRILFDRYLFPIWNWSRGLKAKPFTAREIDTYKRISETYAYTYAKRASSATPFFQITEPFIAGNDFFEMVDHYLHLLHDVRNEVDTNASFASMSSFLGQKDSSAGFGYAKELFYCALLCYYDKFHNFDEMAVKKLFTWAMMIRVDMENLGWDSINKYAIGDAENTQYTNAIPVFSRIGLARLHTEISGLQIRVLRREDAARVTKWNKLYQVLKVMNGIGEVSNA